MTKAPAYVIISLVFLILIGMVFSYSYFFYPNAHPIDCMIKKRTGKDCPTCGFSRSFSHYTHFEFKQGTTFNPRSLPVFVFFVFQFFLRLFIICRYFFRKKTPQNRFLKGDVIITTLSFLISFVPLLF